MDVRFHTGVEQRDNEEYLQLKRVQVDITCKKMKNSFDHLFHDQAISDNVNSVMNESSELIFNEIRKEFGTARGRIVRNLLAPLFERYPYRTLFAAE